MHYRESGSGTPVIAIHGWPETSQEWTKVAEQLGDGIRLLALDTRGHGQSEAPESGYDRATLAQDIVDFMDALDIERCPVIAHDWGGIIAVKLALDHSDRVERLGLLDTICTGWPLFSKYYYWFMDGDRAERFLTTRGRDFIRSIVGGHNTDLPPPPDCPVEFQSHEMTAPEVWATEEHLEAYWRPLVEGEDARVSCVYYRSMQFHRVIPDADAEHGERYELVPHSEMGRMWREQNMPDEYLDFAPEDRHKTYEGSTLWLVGDYLLQATESVIGEDGLPVGDPIFESFPRHFPNLSAQVVSGGHFFLESEPQMSAELIRGFINS